LISVDKLTDFVKCFVISRKPKIVKAKSGGVTSGIALYKIQFYFWVATKTAKLLKSRRPEHIKPIKSVHALG